jgi:pyridoxamine 5'-phosphate oxidase
VDNPEQELTRRLRQLPVLEPCSKTFDPEQAPDHPGELFVSWLEDAIDSDAREPHAMTLSTVDSSGRPDSRVLILKGVGDGRWLFATSRESRKGEEIAATPWAAANFYWPEVGRQVRIRGRVLEAGADETARDFLDRPGASRAASFAGNQGKPLTDPDEVGLAFAEAAAAIESNPRLIPEHWALFQLAPDEVEFWQSDSERQHIRLRYELVAGRWSRQRLWP